MFGFTECSVDYGCGTAIVGGWRTSHPSWASRATCKDLTQLGRTAGTGYFISSFINNSDNKQAYEELTDRFPVVFQSDVRKNANTGNDFFFCVFDSKKILEKP